jgi:molybdopterin synthase catalytic subunit
VNVRVLFFAVLRERARVDEDTVILHEGATTADALAAVASAYPSLEPLLSRVQVAVNRRVVPRDRLLAEGDEVALLPPVAGGSENSPTRIAVLATPLSIDAVVAAVWSPEQGGIVTFTGVVRRQGQVDRVVRLEYEAYEPMTAEVLLAIAGEIESATPGVRVAIHHRVGALAVGDVAVVIAVSAPHRAEAFDGCRAAIEELKSRAPIWKKEIGEDGAIWVGLGP